MTVTTDEAAEIAGVSPVTVRSWVLRGDLEPVRRGAKPLRFHYEDVARVQREKRSGAWVTRHAEAVARWDAGLIATGMQR
ncbi:DNA-binding protein [Nocardioides marmoriginsengisoli]|uniref:DNA-binding protein n=1 Tax=Nocardioides marmoriginsengisoli TaxID=661483 RepID=A0A3N0CJL6_9ACTN|nr:DNA-binding protein [Nocardioides marmoriginsengisoli]